MSWSAVLFAFLLGGCASNTAAENYYEYMDLVKEGKAPSLEVGSACAMQATIHVNERWVYRPEVFEDCLNSSEW